LTCSVREAPGTFAVPLQRGHAGPNAGYHNWRLWSHAMPRTARSLPARRSTSTVLPNPTCITLSRWMWTCAQVHIQRDKVMHVGFGSTVDVERRAGSDRAVRGIA